MSKNRPISILKKETLAEAEPPMIPTESRTARLANPTDSLAEPPMIPTESRTARLANPTDSLAEPLCPVFGSCGGCSYQHLRYETELALKQESMKRIFAGFIPDGEAVLESIVPSPESYFYRSRLDLALRRFRDGHYEIGFQKGHSKSLIPVQSCVIAMRPVSDFLPGLQSQALENIPAKYRTATLVVKTGDDGRVFWGGIGRRSLRLEEKDYLWTEIQGKRIHYSLDTFFQANLSILESLMRKIQSWSILTPESIFFDFYGGVGLFGICFADQAGRVIILEENPAAVKIAAYNASFNRFSNVTAITERVEERLDEILAAQTGKHKVMMVDPPRRGLSPYAAERLSRARELNDLLYLSCYPESLKRDLDVFLKAGWRIQKMTPFDFFPKTHHIETLVWLKP